MGWLLYSWDLDKGSGQGVVKAVVLEVKDLSWSWMSFRAADKSKNCMEALQEPLDLPDTSFYTGICWASCCLLAKSSLEKKKNQAVVRLLKRYEEEHRAETGERISEEAPGGPS